MNKKTTKISIELTKDQFLALLKAVYLGNWVANAIRGDRPEVPIKKEYESIEDLIFSYAKRFGFGKYVDEENSKDGKFYPTRDFEEKTDVQYLLADYDEEIFWSELADRLADRDFHRRYSDQEIKNMGKDERFKKLCELTERWEEEFYKSGIDNLIVWKISDKD